MMGLKLSEVLMILVVVLLLFGANRLPQLGQSLGSAIRNFKKGFAGEDPPEETAKPQGALASASQVKEATPAAAKATKDA